MATTKATTLAHTLASTTSSTADLNYAKTLNDTGVTSTEFDKLDGLTATTNELNLVDGSVTGPLSHRNMIINGAMQVHQRVATNTLVQASNASITTGLTVDRFKFWENTDGTYQTKHNAVTDLAGFTNSLYLSPNDADTSIASGQYAFFAQLIEAQNLQHLTYGTAGAKTMTLSFYIKSNLTGKMTVYVAKYDNTTRIVPLEFDLPSSTGTWERITLTVPALTETAAGVINNDNGMGLEIGWYMSAGSTYKVGTSGTWSSNGNGYSTANHNVNFMSSTSNYIEITGIQLELGSVATPFEHRSFDDELARCKRYYQEIFDNGADCHAVGVWFLGANDGALNMHLPHEMRAQPSAQRIGDPVNTSGGGAASDKWALYVSGAWKGCSSLNISQVSKRTIRVDPQPNDSVSGGDAGGLYAGSACYIKLGAEL